MYLLIFRLFAIDKNAAKTTFLMGLFQITQSNQEIYSDIQHFLPFFAGMKNAGLSSSCPSQRIDDVTFQ